MAEVLVVYAQTATDARGVEHTARACGREQDNGRWEIWLELEPTTGAGVVRTGVETTQPDREAATRWACGISRVYLNGALRRASASARVLEAPRATAPRADVHEAVLVPTEVIAGGEEHLRCRLGALSTAHLRDVARAERTVSRRALERYTRRELVDAIIEQARALG